MTPLNHALADITGLSDPLHEAGQPLKFPERPITPIPHDPLSDADGAIQEATHDLRFAVIEAFNANDHAGMAQLLTHIQTAADGLLVVETMARDFTMRMQR